MDQQEFDRLLLKSVTEKLSLWAYERQGMYRGDGYVEVVLCWEGEPIDRITINIPAVD